MVGRDESMKHKHLIPIRNRANSESFTKHWHGKTAIVKYGKKNWRVKIRQAQLDRDMNFVSWIGKIINWKLWYRKFPSDRCTHWIPVKDPNCS